MYLYITKIKNLNIRTFKFFFDIITNIDNQNIPENIFNHITLSQDFDNWWYLGRKKLLDYIIKNINLTKECSILEIGPGVGVNIEVLQKYGTVDILEIDQYFVHLIKNNPKIKINKIYKNFSEVNQKYDLIVLLDVLEHINDYDSFLKSLSNSLKDNGIGILSVPAYQSLFSKHDIDLKHFRRYNWRLLQDQLNKYFFINKKIGFNYILLPLRFLQIKFLKRITTDIALNKVANGILKKVINLEFRLLKIGLNPNFGLSLFSVFKKNI